MLVDIVEAPEVIGPVDTVHAYDLGDFRLMSG